MLARISSNAPHLPPCLLPPFEEPRGQGMKCAFFFEKALEGLFFSYLGTLIMPPSISLFA